MKQKEFIFEGKKNVLNVFTLNELFLDKKQGDVSLKRCAVCSWWAGRTTFIPWFYNPFNDKWVGYVRWKGANNRVIEIDSRKGNGKVMYILEEEKWPILPENHEVRKVLETKEKKINYLINKKR